MEELLGNCSYEKAVDSIAVACPLVLFSSLLIEDYFSLWQMRLANHELSVEVVAKMCMTRKLV